MLPYKSSWWVSRDSLPNEDPDIVECCTLLYHCITCEMCTKSFKYIYFLPSLNKGTENIGG